MATKKSDIHVKNKLWPEPIHRVENGVWILENDQVGRNTDQIFDLGQLELGENDNKAWVITTKHGPVLVETWKRSGDSTTYIEYQIWIDQNRYWQRKEDKYNDDSERFKSVDDFVKLVRHKIAGFERIVKKLRQMKYSQADKYRRISLSWQYWFGRRYVNPRGGTDITLIILYPRP